MTLKTFSEIPSTPKAVGPYSTAVISGNLLYTSGQVPLCPNTNKIIKGGIEAQTEQVMKNLQAILSHFSINFSSVVKTTIFITNMDDFNKINAVYADHMGDSRPARSTVQVAKLPLDAQIEIEMIAEVK